MCRCCFFFSSRRRHTRFKCDWSSDVCSSDLELPTAVYRVDKSGTLTQVVGEDQVPDPNGLCFSPDYKKLYVISTGKGPGDTHAGGKGDMYVFDVGGHTKLSNTNPFTPFIVARPTCGPPAGSAHLD